MIKIINEKWDIQVVDKLRQYLKEAPKGKYATEATALLDTAMKSDHLRMLGPSASDSGTAKSGNA